MILSDVDLENAARAMARGASPTSQIKMYADKLEITELSARKKLANEIRTAYKHSPTYCPTKFDNIYSLERQRMIEQCYANADTARTVLSEELSTTLSKLQTWIKTIDESIDNDLPDDIDYPTKMRLRLAMTKDLRETAGTVSALSTVLIDKMREEEDNGSD